MFLLEETSEFYILLQSCQIYSQNSFQTNFAEKFEISTIKSKIQMKSPLLKKLMDNNKKYFFK